MKRSCAQSKGGRGPRRLFWRVYMFGILLLAVVAFSVGLANHMLSSPSSHPWVKFRSVANLVDEELTPLIDHPRQLKQKVDRLHRAFAIDVAVFDAQGLIMASAGSPPPPLRNTPEGPRWLNHGAAIPIAGGRAYVIGAWGSRGPRWLLVPFVVLFVLALVTIPLARSIVRPIEQVTRAARAVGDGQLDARTGVRRRDEVGVLAAAFDDMAARLERLVAGEKELRANVSHELRTPLARIRIALEIAEEGSQDPDTVRKHLRGIRGDIIELEELVDQVLITARLDLGSEEEIALRRCAISLAELSQGSATRFGELHPDHKLELDIATPDAQIVTADPKLVKRVIDNLLDNSAKYAAASDGAVTLEVRYSPGTVVLTVRDRGAGVTTEELARLFEPFFQANSVRSQNSKGVGLGLSFCRRVIDAHGGNITAQRRPGGGLAVAFSLPASS